MASLMARRRPINKPVLALAQFIIALAAAAAYLLGHGLLGLALFAASLTLLALTDRYRFRNFASVTLSVVNPRMLLLILAQLGGEALVRVRLLIRGRSSTTQSHHTSYTLPFEGRWLVASGGRSWRTSHSWHLIGQRYAYDFVAVDEQGHGHRATGRLKEDHLSYGQPVLAPADGVVAHVGDGVRDAVEVGTGWVDWRSRDFRGNFVVIRHAEAEYSLLAHLVPGSIALEAGDRVQRGQRVGLCGHSGHSTEPHLHFQVQDRGNFFLAASLPVAFTNTVLNGEKQTGPLYLSIGDLVERAQ